MGKGLLWATMIVLAAASPVAASPDQEPASTDDPLAMLEADDVIGQAPLSGRRSDEDDALAALEQGKGLTVELTRLPQREVQAVGSGAVLHFGTSQTPAAPAPSPSAPTASAPPASAPSSPPPAGGIFGSVFPGANFGN